MKKILFISFLLFIVNFLGFIFFFHITAEAAGANETSNEIDESVEGNFENGLKYPTQIEEIDFDQKELIIPLKNITDKEITVKVRIVDIYSEYGVFHINPSKDNQFQLGKWIDLDTDTVTLKPGESKNIKLSFERFTQENIVPGDYYGLVLFEDENADNSEEIYEGDVNGVKLHLNVPGDPKENITLYAFESSENNQFLYVVFVNQGSKAGNFEGTVHFEGVKKHDLLIEDLFPGEAESFFIKVGDEKWGPLHAIVKDSNDKVLGEIKVELFPYNLVFTAAYIICLVIGSIAALKLAKTFI
jgi:hypothetical protein